MKSLTQFSFGRRKVLITGGFGQSLCFFLLGALSKVAADQKSASIGAAAGSFIFIYDFIFAATWLSVPWVYVGVLLLTALVASADLPSRRRFSHSSYELRATPLESSVSKDGFPHDDRISS